VQVKKGSNVISIKSNNRSLLLNAIKKHNGISRVELSNITGLSKGGISPIISELLNLGMIKETGFIDTDSGRKPIQLEINSSCCYTIVIDWTRKDFTIALVDFAGRAISINDYIIEQKDTLGDVLNKIKHTVAELIENNRGKRIIGIGVVAPGPLDYKNGIILTPPNFRGWSDIPIGSMLEKEFKFPVFVDNNSNAHALAEKNFGVGKHYHNFINMIVDEGIGAGIIIDDNIYRGTMGFGSEIGHVTINMNGPQCKCGNTGCLEVYATIPRLTDYANHALALDKEINSYLSDAVSMNTIKWSDILDGLNLNDEFCVNILNKEIEYIGNILITLINIFAPQAIVIGSQLAMAGEHITKPLEEFVYNKIIARKFLLPGIYTSKLSYASLKGGATMVFEHFINGDLGQYEELLDSKQ
jgi:N-acetylglucosamine repressor